MFQTLRTSRNNDTFLLNLYRLFSINAFSHLKDLDAQWKLHSRANFIVDLFTPNHLDKPVLTDVVDRVVFGAVVAASNTCLTIIDIEYKQSSLFDPLDRSNMPLNEHNLSSWFTTIYNAHYRCIKNTGVPIMSVLKSIVF